MDSVSGVLTGIFLCSAVSTQGKPITPLGGGKGGWKPSRRRWLKPVRAYQETWEERVSDRGSSRPKPR